MLTPDLFALQPGSSIGPRARRTDPHTSKDAAASASGVASRHRVACLICLRFYGHNGMTGHEIAAKTGLTVEQVCRRLPELHEQGTIDREQVGTMDGKPLYRTRNSPSGRPCAVWRVVK